MKRIRLALAIAGVCFASVTMADIIHPVGAGTHAFALANNFVALSNDMSATYWNPAGLAFTQVKEFQVGVGGLFQRNESTLFDSTTTGNVQRLRFNDVGLLLALPTARGGITFAITLQSPWVFDDVLDFNSAWVDTTVARQYSTYGDIRLLSGSFGLQLAPGLAVGLSAGLIFGREHMQQSFLKTSGGSVVADSADNDYHESIERRLVGFDLRVGMMYVLMDRIRLGLRFAIPQHISFSGTVEGADTSGSTTYDYNGTMLSSYTGAFGIAAVLPFATFSGEARARLPYSAVYVNDNIPESSDAKHWKVGLGIGAESPLLAKSLVLRLGYSWDEFDQNLFTSLPDGEDRSAVWDNGGTSADRNSHLIAGGIGCIVRNVRFDLAYGYEFWKLTTNQTLSSTQGMHRVDFSVAARF